MIVCLSPDCHKVDEETEAGKRRIIAHINLDHDDAHVLIACRHDWREIERYMARTTNAQGVQIDAGRQVRSQCDRCGQFEVTDEVPA